MGIKKIITKMYLSNIFTCILFKKHTNESCDNFGNISIVYEFEFVRGLEL